MLGRLGRTIASLTGAGLVPPCPECGVSMELLREDAVGALVIEQVYVCGRCGRHVMRVQPWAIPD